MTRALFLLSAALITLHIDAHRAAAQGSSCSVVAPGPSCSVDFSLTMPTVRVVILELSTTNINFPPFGSPELSGGYVASPGPGALVKANTAWNLMVSAGSQGTWQAVGELARADKPSSDLQWATTTGGPYTDLTTTSTRAAQGGATGDSWVPFSFRTKLGWQSDVPGQYALTIMYVIIAP